MTAFDNAWTLLKNRGFEMDPRYEDERERNIQLVDNLEELEMMEALGTPSQYREMVDSRNRQLSQLGPMYQHQQDQEAERIEAEGIELPDVPSTVTFEDDYPDRSTAPPADIGRAGSSIPPGRGLEPKYLFNPFKYDYNNPTATHQIDHLRRQPTGRSFDDTYPLNESLQEQLQQTPQYKSLVEMMRQDEQLRQQSEALEQTPLGQALAQARSQPPRPLQFEKAWATLKADPNMLDREGRSIPPAIFNITNHPYRGITDVEGVYRTPRPSAYHFLQDADEEEEQTMRQNERRFGPLGSILAQDTDKGREFYQYRGPDVSSMYAPVPQPE